MNTQQPKALLLVDALTFELNNTDAEDDVILVSRWFVEDSIDELRRLHSLNTELLEALNTAARRFELLAAHDDTIRNGVRPSVGYEEARAATTKATGEQA